MSAKNSRKKRRQGPAAAPARPAQRSALPQKADEADAAEPGTGSVQDASALTWPWMLAIITLAFVIRVVVAVQLGRTALFQVPQLDGAELLDWARRIAGGSLRLPPSPSHGPGYPYFLGGLLALSGGSLGAARVAQSALGALLCGLTAALAARTFGRRAGMAAGLLLALYAPLVYVEVSLLAEGLLTFLLVGVLWCLTPPHRLVAAAMAGAGVLLGLAVAVRATALVLLPILAVLLILDRRRSQRVRAAVLFTAGCVLVVAPLLVATHAATRGWLLVQSFGGLNFYMGNRPGSLGVPSARLGGEWDRLQGEPLRQGITNPAEQERYFVAKETAELRAHPLESLRVLGRKAVWLIQDEEVRESHSFYFFRGQSALLRWLPTFGLLFPFATLGLAVAWRQRRLAPELGAYLLAMAGTCVLIIVASRYRIPFVPVLAVFAGGAVAWLIGAATRRQWKALAGGAAVLAAGLLATHLRRHDPSHDLAEEWALTATSLANSNRTAEARQAVARALREDARSALAWEQDGLLRWRDGDAPGAERAFNTAARLEPDFERARFYLGVIARRRGEIGRAIGELRRALWLSPYDVPALEELGEVLLEQGNTQEAAELFRRVIALDAGNAAAYASLARIEGAARHPREGMELAARAAQLEPEKADTWLLAAMLALDAGEAATARESLGNAQRLLGAEAPAVGFGWALLDRLEGRPEAAEQRLRAVLQRAPGFQPAARLLLASAAERGRRAEAEAFLSSLPGAQ
jgi:tetratricopeptide (TPR) repeat protein